MPNPANVGLALTGWALPVVYLALAAFAGVILLRHWRQVGWLDRLALGSLSIGAGIWASLAGVWIVTAAYTAVGQAQSIGWAVLEVVLAMAAIHVVRRAYLDPRTIADVEGR
jgi:hypothetical protein